RSSVPSRTPHPDVHPFPTRRSSDLSLAGGDKAGFDLGAIEAHDVVAVGVAILHGGCTYAVFVAGAIVPAIAAHFGKGVGNPGRRSEEHTSKLQSRENLVCRLLLEKK